MPLLVTGARGPWSRTSTRRVWTERYRIVSCPRLGEARAVQREAFDWALGEMETSSGLGALAGVFDRDRPGTQSVDYSKPQAAAVVWAKAHRPSFSPKQPSRHSPS